MWRPPGSVRKFVLMQPFRALHSGVRRRALFYLERRHVRTQPPSPLQCLPCTSRTKIMPEGNPSPPARVPYVFPAPGTSEVADGIRSRRSGQNPGLIDLDGVLLHAEPVAESWNALGRALRTRTTLSMDVVEALILRVSVLNGSAYVWNEHDLIARQAGLSPTAIFTIRTTPAFAFAASTGSISSGAHALSPLHLAALDYADHMTRTVRVPQAVFARLQRMLRDDRQIVEATAVVAGYNLTTRVLRALDVAGLAEEEVPIPSVE